MSSTPVSMSTVLRAATKLALTFALALAPACASFGPPARPSPPSVSPGGIELVVVAQSCTQSSDPDWQDQDLAEAVVEVHVSNATTAALTVRRNDFRLVTPAGDALRTESWRAAEPLVVVGGAARTFELRFQSHGGLACGRELWLDPRAGLVVGSKIVSVEPVRLDPWRSRAVVGVASASALTPGT